MPGTSMARWPGYVFGLGGLAATIAAVAALDASGGDWADGPRSPVAAVAWIAAVATTLGLSYALIRQLRMRRRLDPDRYRGPSVIGMLALAVILGVAITLPFSADAMALFGEGSERASLLGTIVLVTSTQAGLLVVSSAFAFGPRALSFARPWIRREPLAAVAAGLGWGVLAWFGMTVLGFLSLVILERVGISPPPQPAAELVELADPWLVVTAIVVVAPVAEELFFRGVVFNAWLRERGLRFAYVGSAALFAVVHVSVVAALPIFALGLGLAWVYGRSRNLLAPIAMHATVNAISTGILYLRPDQDALDLLGLIAR